MSRPVTMQKRHFSLIAETIKAADLTDNARFTVARDFANKLHATNGKFDRSRFMTACGVES